LIEGGEPLSVTPESGVTSLPEGEKTIINNDLRKALVVFRFIGI